MHAIAPAHTGNWNRMWTQVLHLRARLPARLAAHAAPGPALASRLRGRGLLLRVATMPLIRHCPTAAIAVHIAVTARTAYRGETVVVPSPKERVALGESPADPPNGSAAEQATLAECGIFSIATNGTFTVVLY